MKTKLFVSIICIASLVVIQSACSVDPDTGLERALDRYSEKDSGSAKDLEKALIRYASIESLDGSDLQSNGTLLYRLNGRKAEICYPRSLTLALSDGEDVTQVAADAEHAVITDGLRIAVFTADGSYLQNETVGDAKSPVRALALDGGYVLYYRNAKVYRYDIAEKKIEEAAKETFPSPYTTYYSVLFAGNGELLGVCAGIAGSYSFSIINPQTGAVLLKNLGMSSSRLFMGTRAVYYITGTSGRWELVRFDIAAKAKKSLASFSDLVDIAPAAGGYICETSAGLYTALYGRDRKRIPFAYKLAGSYKGRVLLLYKGTYYFMDMARLHEGLERVRERAPELMNASSS